MSTTIKKQDITKISIIRQKDILPGLPYEGSMIDILINNSRVAETRHIDFLPECLFIFGGLKGKGRIAVSNFKISRNKRPRPEYLYGRSQ